MTQKTKAQTEALAKGGGLPGPVGTSHSAGPLCQGDGQCPIEESFEDEMCLSLDLHQRDGRDGSVRVL